MELKKIRVLQRIKLTCRKIESCNEQSKITREVQKFKTRRYILKQGTLKVYFWALNCYKLW